MRIELVQSILETTSFETANQYLRFGWKLINQHLVAAAGDRPTMVNYVLASVRTLQDTRRLLELTSVEQVNQHLEQGWRLLDTYVSAGAGAAGGQQMHFVLCWQTEELPQRLVSPARQSPVEAVGGDELQAEDEILPESILGDQGDERRYPGRL
jgi:hypothetical protein